MKTLPMRKNTKPIKCKVQVMTKNGKAYTYQGLYKSTVEAAMDAFERFGLSSVSVRAS